MNEADQSERAEYEIGQLDEHHCEFAATFASLAERRLDISSLLGA